MHDLATLKTMNRTVNGRDKTKEIKLVKELIKLSFAGALTQPEKNFLAEYVAEIPVQPRGE